MRLVKKRYGVFFVLMIAHLVHAQTDFILKPAKKKKVSVNQLKENIGQATKTLFQTTTSMNKQLGMLHIDIAQAQSSVTKEAEHIPVMLEQSLRITKTFGTLQMEVATLQTKFSNVIEKLVENQRPFKKASRTDLEDALTTIQTANQQLSGTVQTYASMSTRIKKDVPDTTKRLSVMKDIEKKLEHHIHEIKNIHTKIGNNACLKAA